jgi:predicted transcriptional regulator
MARNLETISLTLRPETLRALDAAAQNERRSRSAFVDLTLERALTGQGRLEALQAIAEAGLADCATPRERAPNATEIIAASSTDGHRRLEALQKIATGGK